MKQRVILYVCIFLFCTIWQTEAQVLNRVKNAVKSSAENTTNKAIDKTLKDGKKKTAADSTNTEAGEMQNTGDKTPAQSRPQATVKSYANYDFVPGDKIIFQYDMAGETDGELPGRLMLLAGNAEIQTYEGEKVLQIHPGDEVTFKPMMSGDTYLPEQFTLEFDVFYEDPDDQNAFSLHVQFPTKEYAELSGWVGQHIVSLENINTTQEGYATVNWSQAGGGTNVKLQEAVTTGRGKWRHVAIYVNKNLGKLYIDEYRIRAVNNLIPGANLVGFNVRDEYNPVLIKNIRLAQGGTDAYNKIVTDGRFIAYGILFDVNKAILKPESMGTLNEIVKIMKAHADLKFEIGGHTDSDGSAATNQKLSQDRADAIKQQLVSMGIEASRLTTQGYGPTKPINDNSSPENKARNRRVEFVKQ